MVKRKADIEPNGSAAPVRRSGRNKPDEPKVKTQEQNQTQTAVAGPKPKAARPNAKKAKSANGAKLEDDTTASKTSDDASSTDPSDSPRYWLMKAEPESRIEKGHDIKFSIDDLAARTEPEPWDGIRNHAARNNLRAMKQGDLAFFYHSSCKIPAIVGIMEIVQEHSPDLTAQDLRKPYYDDKDRDPDNPKWSVVHVEFRRKFKYPVTLHELKDLAKDNKVLAGMDLLSKGRLSVGKVSKEEWEMVMALVEAKEEAGEEGDSDGEEAEAAELEEEKGKDETDGPKPKKKKKGKGKWVMMKHGRGIQWTQVWD